MTRTSPGTLWGLCRLAAGDGTFRMPATDQRPPLEKPESATGHGPERVTALEGLLAGAGLRTDHSGREGP